MEIKIGMKPSPSPALRGGNPISSKIPLHKPPQL